MTRLPSDSPASRRIACARCGTSFECRPAGDCWCADETARLPMPVIDGEDCLCQACLRAAARVSSLT